MGRESEIILQYQFYQIGCSIHVEKGRKLEPQKFLLMG
jgi:hypothetical protein